ncbi:MAG: hypothetical protein K9N47_19420 [Prosthecobacter sp.]|uniref:hypothetical protein n=1 Tax=Prosthecobacter sp. TaxID=1965333 RepID=UPI0025E5B499|nr:hypothetical protein [Prosthecobacter sp.]MCF7788302.1 hypothetical protein [Prosthecobacter sp.]
MISQPVSEAKVHGDKPVVCMLTAGHASTGAELACLWKDVPRLGIEEADEFAADIAEGLSKLQAAAE